MNKLLVVAKIDPEESDRYWCREQLEDFSKHLRKQVSKWFTDPKEDFLGLVIVSGVKIEVHQLKDEDQPELVRVNVVYE
jgi:hypothetical protein